MSRWRMAGSTSSPSPSDGLEHAQELGPYETILTLLRRQQEQALTPSAEEADAAFRQVVELVLKLFADYATRHGNPPLPENHALTATEAAVVSTHVLRAADIALFELAMWQAWSGAAEIDDLRVGAFATRTDGRRTADG
jgi:hypothetical protein